MLIECSLQIAQRLKERCPAVNGNVFLPADLVGIQEKDQVTPALHVLLYSYRPRDQVDGDGLWDESYIVYAVVRNAAQRDRVAAQMQDAIPLLQQALDALCAWKPAASTCALELLPPPRPHFSDYNAYFPLMFGGRPLTTVNRSR